MNTKSPRRGSLLFIFPVPIIAGFVLLLTVFAGLGVADASYATKLDGSVADFVGADEMLMESETSTRFLLQLDDHISYDALKANQAVCPGKKGGPTNCLPPGSNIYERGCQARNRCRGGKQGFRHIFFWLICGGILGFLYWEAQK